MSLPEIGFALDALPIMLTRDRVIEFFEGDRIVLLRSEAKDPYLQIWYDTDGATTRWILLRISDNDLGHFLHADRTLLDIIVTARDGHVYMLDTRGGATVRVAFLRPKDIPNDGMPTKESFYDDSLTPVCAANLPKEQLVLLDGEWSAGDLAAWERTYTQVYAYNALLGASSAANMSDLHAKFMNYRFVGSGWSHVTAADQIVGLMARDAKPKFRSVQLSSPGAVRYSVDSANAASVREALKSVGAHREDAKSRYEELHEKLSEVNRTVRELESRGRESEVPALLVAPNEGVKDAAFRLANILGQIDPDRVWIVAGTDINGGELVANYYRRLTSLREDEEKGHAIIV